MARAKGRSPLNANERCSGTGIGNYKNAAPQFPPPVPALHLKGLTVQREIEFVGVLLGVERAAGEEAVTDLNGADFALAVVDAEDQVFGMGIVFDVVFAAL